VTKKTYDISVLVLCYNASRYIEQCLQSVLDQKHDLNIQLVVLDDASSDDSFAHIENLLHPSSLTEVVTVQNEQNLGCFGNLQKGISLCTGKYIAYLEGDDYWISLTKLQDQFDYLETNSQLAGVGGRCQFVDPTGEELPQKYYTETRDITWSNKTFWNYPPFQASSFMFRRFGNLPGLCFRSGIRSGNICQNIVAHGTWRPEQVALAEINVEGLASGIFHLSYLSTSGIRYSGVLIKN